jgi:hypothetical protein
MGKEALDSLDSELIRLLTTVVKELKTTGIPGRQNKSRGEVIWPETF